MVFDKERFRTLVYEVADELGIRLSLVGFRKSVFYSAEGNESSLGTLIHTPFELDVVVSLERGRKQEIPIQVDPLDTDASIRQKLKASLGLVLLSSESSQA